MTRLALLLCASLLAPVAVSAPVPKPDSDADRVAKLLGKAVYPAKGCRFVVDGTTVTAKLPKEKVAHPENWTYSMRTEKEIAGDFELTAAVRTTSGRVPFQGPKSGALHHAIGGGLVAWCLDDEKPKDRDVVLARWFERVRERRGDPSTWEEERRASYPGTEYVGQADGTDPQRPLFLRISRAGKTVRTATSEDGKTWKEWAAREVDFGKRVAVGVWAFNLTDEPADVVFEEFSLRQK